MRRRDRGTSVTLSYVLTLAIVVALVTGLLVAAGDFVHRQQESTIRAELEVVGEQVAADLAHADRLSNTTGSNTAVRVRSPLPSRVAGESYTVTVNQTDGREHVLTLRTESPAVAVTVGFVSSTPVQNRTVRGGDVRVSYVPGPPAELEVQDV